MRILWILLLLGAAGCTPHVCDGIDPSCSAAILIPWMKVYKPRFFYGSDQNPNSSVTQHYSDPNTGTLGAVAPKLSLAPATALGQLTSDINGRFLYGASGSGVVSIMKIGATTGILSLISNVAVPGTTPYGIVYDVQQRFVFVSTTGGSGTISTYAPSYQSGLLTLIATFNPSVICGNAGGLAAHPNGRFLYCAGGTTIAGLGIDQNSGTLSNLSTATATGSVQSLAFDSTGTLLLVSTSTNAEAYAINQTTGALTQKSSQAFAGMGAYGIAVVQNNLYVTNNAGIRALAFDSA